MRTIFRHIVAWNFKDGFSDEENLNNAIKLKKDIESLKNVISEIVEIKVNIKLATTSTRKVMLDSLFKSEEDLAKYQVHPEHIKVSEFVGSVMKERVCLDFEQ